MSFTIENPPFFEIASGESRKLRSSLPFWIKTALLAFSAAQKSASGHPWKLPALRAEVDAPAQKSAGAFSCFSSSRASYPSPRRERQGSLIPPILLSPRDPPSAGLARGPRLRCPSACAHVALTDYSVVHFSAVRPLCSLLPQNGPHGGQHRASRAGRWFGCHPAHRRATRGLTTRNGGGHVSDSADPTCAGPPPASTPRGILPRVPSKSAQLA